MNNKKYISLDDNPIKHPFKVPENYFESLPMEIQGKLPQRQTRSFSLYKKVAISSISIAAIVILLFTLLKDDQLTNKTTDQLLSTVSDASLIAYLDNVQFDEEELFNEVDTEYNFQKNVISNNIEQQTLKAYEDTYFTEDDLDLYDYE